MKLKKLWTIVGIVVVAAAVIVFMLCWNRSQTPHKVLSLPLMRTASATDIARNLPKETSKAAFTYHEADKTLNLASSNQLTVASVFSYSEYLFTDPNALSKDPALFFLWNTNIGGIDDDMKNALFFAFSPDIRSGKIRKYNDSGKYQKGSWTKSYRFFTVNRKLTNYDYTDGSAHYNVHYRYNADGSIKQITYSNSTGFSMDITVLYQDGISGGFIIHDTGSGKTTTEKWTCHRNSRGRVTSFKTDTRTYTCLYDRSDGYLTQIGLADRYRMTYSYGKGHRLEKVESIVNINGKRDSTLNYQFQY